MTNKTKISILIAVLLWGSAYVGIRAGLREYSPEGLALLRYLIASLCMGIIYYKMPKRNYIRFWDKCALLGIGVLGIGVYNLALNYGELGVSSGMASFIISQAPVISAVLAIVFLGESLNVMRVIGFIVSVLGVGLIAQGEVGGFEWNMSILSIILATVAASCYLVMQKPFLNKYHAIEATTYLIWGGTLFLVFYFPQLMRDVSHASFASTLTVAYLGVFPAAIGYLMWSYVMGILPLSQAASFLYLVPFAATFLGWLLLNEVPMLISAIGALLSMTGVYLINRTYLIKD